MMIRSSSTCTTTPWRWLTGLAMLALLGIGSSASAQLSTAPPYEVARSARLWGPYGELNGVLPYTYLRTGITQPVHCRTFTWPDQMIPRGYMEWKYDDVQGDYDETPYMVQNPSLLGRRIAGNRQFEQAARNGARVGALPIPLPSKRQKK